eukprot:scaffold3360_cov69-Cylindrotheca_fusiformis.AAC.2
MLRWCSTLVNLTSSCLTLKEEIGRLPKWDFKTSKKSYHRIGQLRENSAPIYWLTRAIFSLQDVARNQGSTKEKMSRSIATINVNCEC